MRYRLQRHDGTDCSATMVPFTVLRMVPIQRYRHVFFDLPTETKKDKREYALFRKRLQMDGFSMFQFSIYVRHCASMDNAAVHIKRVKSFLPKFGHVAMMCITDKQFANIEVFHGTKEIKGPSQPTQLELF